MDGGALERYLERDHDRIAPLGRSVVLTHGRRVEKAAVLLHGISATPAQFSAISAELHARGYNVFVPRLPRHGYTDRFTGALAQMRADHLRAAARDAVAAGRELGEHVIVAGFSLGGLLTAHVAQHEPIDHAIAIAPFLGVAMIPNRFRRTLSELALRVPNYFGWWDPLRRDKLYPEHGYPRWSSHALAHALTLANELFADALVYPPAARRVTLVANARETAVNNRAIAHLGNLWRAHGTTVALERLTSVPYSHDIIEPLRAGNAAQRALPDLLRIIDS
jgi:alpha-beta hydrolase superfamily lysophospholipase